MLDSLLRPLKDALIAPLADAVGARFSPNTVSIAAFAVGLACAAFLTVGFDAAALVLWLFNRTLDGLDGLIARRSGRSSDFGGYLDIVLDFIVYALIPIGMAAFDPALALPCALMLASFYVNSATWMYLSAVLEKRGRSADTATSVIMPAGLIEGTETIVLFTLMIIFHKYRSVLFYAAAALTSLGAAVRFAQGARLLKGGRRDPDRESRRA